jgi:hypothetical protein
MNFSGNGPFQFVAEPLKGSARVQQDFDAGVFGEVDLMAAGEREKREDFEQATDHGGCGVTMDR